MEYIDGDNLFNWVNKQKNKDTVTRVLRNFIQQVNNKIHVTEGKKNLQDIHQMYFEKPEGAMEFFGKKENGNLNTYVINGGKVEHPSSLLKTTYKNLKSRLENTRNCFIHGDTTLGNTLISTKNNIYHIDPRGRFGNTKYYGDPRYDFGKLLFSMIGGFTALNEGNFEVKRINSGEFEFQIKELPFKDELERVFYEEIREDEVVMKYIHATIWLSLPPHLDDEKQMLTAFLQGSYLLGEINRS